MQPELEEQENKHSKSFGKWSHYGDDDGDDYHHTPTFEIPSTFAHVWPRSG